MVDEFQAMVEGARRATGTSPGWPRRNSEGTTMSDSEKTKPKKRILTPEKKFQIFLESQRGETPVGEILRREGLYSSDLARIRQQVKDGAMDRLAARPGKKRRPPVAANEYEALKRELEEKERALADLSVELTILRKKTNGGSWDR